MVVPNLSTTLMGNEYDAVVLLSFGGPEGPDEVMPFLENVTRGRDIPRARLDEVAQQYQRFGGVSPINSQNRALLQALSTAMAQHGHDIPLYWGNRNWHPTLQQTTREMQAAGHRRVLAIVTSAFGSYSGCRQYSEDIDRAVTEVGGGITIDKARLYWNHPGFLEAVTDRVHEAMEHLEPVTTEPRLIFTAHSIPTAWVATSPYVDQLRAAASHVSQSCAPDHKWDLVFQSRSGPPHVPWLEPDINDHLRALRDDGVSAVVVVPLGFVSDHMEVVFDLDVQARATAEELGLKMVRATTAGTHPAFVEALRQLITEASTSMPALTAVGEAWPNPCPRDCCDIPVRPRPDGSKPRQPSP